VTDASPKILQDPLVLWHKNRDAATFRIRSILVLERRASAKELHETLLDMDYFSSDGEVQRLGASLLRESPPFYLLKKGAVLSNWAHTLMTALSRHSLRRSSWVGEDATPGTLRPASGFWAEGMYSVSPTYQLLFASLHVIRSIWVENPRQGPACSRRMARMLTKVASSITPNPIYPTYEATG